MRHYYPHNGFSLMEVLMVLSLVVMLNHLLLPDWQQAFNNTAFSRQQQSIFKLITQGRTWALVNDKPLVICGWSAQCVDSSSHQEEQVTFSKTTSDATNNVTLLAFSDSNDDRLWQAHEKVVAKLTLKNIYITFNRGDYVRFSASGSTAQTGSLQLCNHYGSNNLSAYGAKLILNSSGNLRLAEVTCAV